MWLHGRRVDDPINAFIARTVADAHPDADRIRKAERDAYAAYERAERSRTRLEEAMDAELHPYGQAAHTRDADSRLAAAVDQLAGVQRDLRTATARVEVLQREPARSSASLGWSRGERERWAADRQARQEAASRDAQQRQQRQQEKTQRIEPPPPSRSTPDHGRGIGR